MNKVTVTIRTDSKTKEEAKKLAKEMGLSLSKLINILVRNFIKTKKLEIDLNKSNDNKS